MDDFIIARNPEAASSLPYLLCVPIGGGLWLKARDSWPRSVRVYCHPADPPDPATLEVIERVAVHACSRRGPAIDMILDRVQNRRSQFVFTAHRGRSLILLQTAKAATSARPGVRIPYSPAPPSLVICIDTRERYPYRFAARGASQVRRALRIADYAVLGGDRIIGAVERKTLEDLAKCLTDGSLGFAMADLASLPSAAVVVEAPYSALLRHAHTPSGYLIDLVARLQVRHPSVPSCSSSRARSPRSGRSASCAPPPLRTALRRWRCRVLFRTTSSRWSIAARAARGRRRHRTTSS
jgi:hypothetical protein